MIPERKASYKTRHISLLAGYEAKDFNADLSAIDRLLSTYAPWLDSGESSYGFSQLLLAPT